MKNSKFKLKNTNKTLVVGAILVGLIVLITIISIWYTPYDPEKLSASDRALAPSLKHIMGTDKLGRDIFSRVMIGIRTTFFIAGVSISVAAFIGTMIGAFAGYKGGLVDAVIMRICDTITAIPLILVGMVFIALFGRGINTVIIALTLAFVPSITRLIRGAYIDQKNRDYVLNARLIGASNIRIAGRHILPNIKKTLLNGISVGFNNLILAEASMSFLGIGVQQPTPSLGAMLSDAQGYWSSMPWYAIFPGLVIVVMVLGFVFISEGLNAEN